LPPKVRMSFGREHLLKGRAKQTPAPAPTAAPQQEAVDPEVIVLDGGDEPHYREAGSKTAAAVQYVNLIPRTPSPS
jgi:hypothetical protein